MSQSNKRLTILTNEEIEGLYARPHFDEKTRACYFELDEQEQVELSSIQSPRSTPAIASMSLAGGEARHGEAIIRRLLAVQCIA